MSTPQTEVAMSLFEDGVNQRGIAEILGVSQSGVSTFLKRFNQCESCENERRRGRLRNSLRCVKTDRLQPQNIAENLQLPRSPRHSGHQTSSGRLHT
jgi:predicted transcriptional regulator